MPTPASATRGGSGWDSLRLFTPARYDGLPGMPFPATRYAFPTKDEMADYLEAYAARFDLPVEPGVKVTRVSARGRPRTSDRQRQSHLRSGAPRHRDGQLPGTARACVRARPRPVDRPAPFTRLSQSVTAARGRRADRRRRQFRCGDRDGGLASPPHLARRSRPGRVAVPHEWPDRAHDSWDHSCCGSSSTAS